MAKIFLDAGHGGSDSGAVFGSRREKDDTLRPLFDELVFYNNVKIVLRALRTGKGSLFLGRMTNLFDGVSFVVQKNSGASESSTVSQEQVKELIAKAMRDFATSLMEETR